MLFRVFASYVFDKSYQNPCVHHFIVIVGCKEWILSMSGIVPKFARSAFLNALYRLAA